MSTPEPEPLPVRATALLRAHALACHRRRAVPPALWLGRLPAREQPDSRADCVSLPYAVWPDEALAGDLVTRALEVLEPAPGGPPEPAYLWLTRTGGPEPEEGDLAWLRAGGTAFARHGLRLGHFVVISRRAWTDLVEGTGQKWYRVRRR